MAQVTGGIGDVRWSILDEPLFQAQNGAYWVLADGRSIANTPLAQLTGMTTVPDMRGVFPRGIDAGRGLDSVSIAISAVAIATDSITLTTAPASVTPYAKPECALAVGQRVQFNTTGTLPAPLVAGTTYYVSSVINTTTFKVAGTFADAVAGNSIDLTTIGTGTRNAVLGRPHGSLQQEDFKSHVHQQVYNPGGSIYNGPYAQTYSGFTGLASGNNTNPSGGSETRPVNVGLYCYVRVY